MQSQDSEQAPQQTTATDSTNDTQSTMAGKALDQLTELAALSWSVSENYSDQFKLTGQTAKAEWQLSGRSLIIAAGLVVCLGVGVILLWGSVLLLFGYVLLQATQSMPITAATLLLLQCVMLFWCWRSLKYVLTQVGFNETWQQLRRVVFAKEAPEATNQQQNTTAQQGPLDVNR